MVLTETSVNPTGNSGTGMTHESCPKSRSEARPLYLCRSLERGALGMEVPCSPGQCSGSDCEPLAANIPSMGVQCVCPEEGCLNRAPQNSLPQRFPAFTAPEDRNVGVHLGILPCTLEHKPITSLPGSAFLPRPSGLDNYFFAKTSFSWHHNC